MSGLKYTYGNTSNVIGFGGGIDIGYVYNFNKRIGLQTGLGIMISNSSISVDKLLEQYTSIDENGYNFEFHYTLSGYRERQSANLLYIPLMLRYTVLQTFLTGIYISGGAKVMYPTTVDVTIDQGAMLTTFGYYDYELQIYADFPRHGFVSDKLVEMQHSKLNLNYAVTLSLEAGIRFIRNNNFDLRLYFDYGLNDMRKSKSGQIIEYQSSMPTQFIYNSILTTSTIKKVNIFGTGLKIGIWI
jgi:hypothetical protein